MQAKMALPRAYWCDHVTVVVMILWRQRWNIVFIKSSCLAFCRLGPLRI